MPIYEDSQPFTVSPVAMYSSHHESAHNRKAANYTNMSKTSPQHLPSPQASIAPAGLIRGPY